MFLRNCLKRIETLVCATHPRRDRLGGLTARMHLSIPPTETWLRACFGPNGVLAESPERRQ
jgi:hypothetical protein